MEMIENADKELKRISEKADVLIGIFLDLHDALTKKRSIRDKVSYLSSRGLSNGEVSRVLGISEGHVSKEKSLLNKEKQEDNLNGREETF